MTASTRQYLRKCQVVIGDATTGKNALVVEDLRVTFEVTKTIGAAPNTAVVRIFNLNPDNEGRVKGEFNEIFVNAGYQGQQLVIFRGNIVDARRIHEGTDYVMEVQAADGDRDQRKTIINVTLEKGTSTQDLINHITGKFTTTKQGHLAIKNTTRGRGEVFSGPATQILGNVALESDAHWSIQDGFLEIVPVDSTLPTEAIVLRSDTGLLKAPELNDKGVRALTLLNPRIRVNGKVLIDNNDLKAKVFKQRDRKPGAKKRKATVKRLARLDPDGVYKVYKVIHRGDTRGNGVDWTTEVHCIALGKPIPKGAQAA
jgi:hypothetical protein